MKRLFSKQSVGYGAAVALLTSAALAVAAFDASSVTKSPPKTAQIAQVERQTLNPASPQVQQATSAAKSLSLAFRAAAQRTLPTVVTIMNRPRVVPATHDGSPQLNAPHGQNPFGQGFGLQPPPQQPPGHAGGMGSGVVIDPAGLVMTNNHVVAGGGEVTVRLHDGREFNAVNVWTDPSADIAIVKIDATGLVAAKLGDSDMVEIGDWVIALGQPFGLDDTVTAGIISAKHRGIGIAVRENFLQTDAAINPGNSGGPLVNLDGEVIGINTAISSRSGGNNGIGFAVPINTAKWIGDQLAHGGKVHRAYLGVGIQPVTAALADKFHVKPEEGVVVTNVMPNTPAAKAGLQAGDVLVQFAGVNLNSPQQLQTLVERAELNRPQTMTIVRNAHRMDLTFKPEEQPERFGSNGGSEDQPAQAEKSRIDNLGLELGTLDADVAKQLGMPGAEGVVITDVQSGSAAEMAGLQSGMVITQVNRQDVKSLSEFQAAVEAHSKDKDKDKSMLLMVRSKAGMRYVVLPMPS